MWLFKKKKREAQMDAKDAEFRKLHNATLESIDDAKQKIDEAGKQARKLNKLLTTTEMIFIATGGEKRSKK